MDVVSSRPFWPIADGLPRAFPPLEADARCDVAVIGGGITGALVAWHLADAGVDVVVLDRREVAHGSTAASTSLLQYELDEPLHLLAARFGPDFALRCYRRCHAAMDTTARLVRRLKVDVGFARKASLQLASQRSHVPRLRREFEARIAAGFQVEWWSRSAIAGASDLPQAAGLFSREAAQCDPYAFAYALLEAAQRRGARVFDRTAVVRRRAHRAGVVLTTSRKTALRARHVVIATGFEADALLPERLTQLYSTYALVSEPVHSFRGWPADRCLIWETARPYLYLRTTPDQRVIVGGYDEPFRDPVARDRLLPAKTAALHRRFGQLFPQMKLEVATAWAGTFANTAAGLPFIAPHPKVPRTWFALGYGGNGITFSVIAAETIRDSILGRKDPDADLFGFDRRPAAGD